MGTKTKRILISGYYGFGNSGDEAVLHSILEALRAQEASRGIRLEPVVLSHDPASTARMYDVSSVHRMKPKELLRAVRSCDGLISGGGSLLQDVTGWKTIPYYLGVMHLAQAFGKPVFIYSQGIGPVSRPLFHLMIRKVFGKAAYISVRDTDSKQLLERMGVSPESIEVVPDPVMGMTVWQEMLASSGTDKEQDGQEAVMGVSVRFWNSNRSELDQLAQSLVYIAKQKQVHFRFLPFHPPHDREASQYVIEQCRRLAGAHVSCELAEAKEDPREMVKEVARCDLMIGMRLHALIYAASQYVPMIGISYDPKIDQFLRQLDMEPVASTDRFDAKYTAKQALKLLEQRSLWRKSKRPKIDALKQKARLPAQHLAQFFRLK